MKGAVAIQGHPVITRARIDDAIAAHRDQIIPAATDNQTVSTHVDPVDVGSQAIIASATQQDIGSVAADQRTAAPCSQIVVAWGDRQNQNILVRPAGFEPTTPRLGIWCSIRLSYGRTGFDYTSFAAKAIRCRPLSVSGF